MRDARLREPLPLAQLRGCEHGGRGIDGMRQRQPLGDAGGDRHRPVDSRSEQAVDALGRGEAVELRLVLDGDDRAAVGETESGRGRIAVGGDHVEVAGARGLEQTELSGTGA